MVTSVPNIMLLGPTRASHFSFSMHCLSQLCINWCCSLSISMCHDHYEQNELSILAACCYGNMRVVCMSVRRHLEVASRSILHICLQSICNYVILIVYIVIIIIYFIIILYYFIMLVYFVHMTSIVCPGRGIPSLLLFLRFPPFFPVTFFFLIWSESLRTEGVICYATDCETP